MLPEAVTTIIQPAVQELAKQVLSFPPLWGLAGVKSIDIATGVAKAIVSKTFDAKLFAKGPMGFLTLLAISALCVCMHAVSDQLDPFITIALCGMGGAQGASVIKNVAAIYQGMGQPAPKWLNDASSFFDSFSDKGVNNDLIAPVEPPKPDGAPAPVTPADQPQAG